ncbi:hypothetical protein V6N13_149478 [Hibiscus sabdariffa]|uniref:Uncharacterized protein n=1 Tax=Hibiscus sabdariffa TaxID=183260 RepID=A0ABR2EH94_9ROSI
MATTTVKLLNLSGDTATLVSSTYGTDLTRIPTGATPVPFKQDISPYTIGAVAYNIGNIVTWIVLWTADNRVATRIVPAGAPVVWKDIGDKLCPDHADDSLTMDDGGTYKSSADLYPSHDGQNLSVTISYAPPPN